MASSAPGEVHQVLATPVARSAPFREDALIEGWLTKQAVSATVLKNWKRRWLTLFPNRIEWRLDETGDVLGSLPVRPTTRVTLIQIVDRLYCAAICHDERELVIEANSAEEIDRWVGELDRAVETSSRSAQQSGCARASPAPRACPTARPSPTAPPSPPSLSPAFPPSHRYFSVPGGASAARTSHAPHPKAAQSI